jgi:adenosylcobinamide-phosphate synthase
MNCTLLVPPLALVVALALDRCLGEPPAWAHPVVGMGCYLGALGPWLAQRAPATAFVGGTVAWLVGAAVVVALARAVERALAALPDALAGVGPVALPCLLAGAALGVLLKTLLAWRMLRDEVAGVEEALAASLEAGRARLRGLVSRDVNALDAVEVRESAIESLAENLSDSVVAPLFWFALGGLSAAALYRFANTADAMWGYRGRYEWVGKWAARADDVLSWLPARITAVLLCVAARRRPSWHRLRRDAGATASPNGGWPMGAVAHLLGVRLAKPGAYTLNAKGAPAAPGHTRQALVWAERVVWLAAALAALVLALPAGLQAFT